MQYQLFIKYGQMRYYTILNAFFCLDYKINKITECPTHENNKKWYVFGNPITSDVIHEYIAVVDEITKNNEKKKSNSMYPLDFHRFGSHLIETNDPINLMLWVIIVTAKAGFLREHEFNTRKLGDFGTKSWPNWNGYGKIPYIIYHLEGKRTRKHYMNMWSDDIHYITDPIVVLFWWLSISKI